jgi:hypothetical protein
MTAERPDCDRRADRLWQHLTMDPGRWLLVGGTVLLSISALLGFVQHRYRARPDAFARWRIVHAGGTAGAVQLIAVHALWRHLGIVTWQTTCLSLGLIVATWAFFLGPLAGALGRDRTARIINGIGAVVAVPSYLCLPVALLW